MKKFSDEELQLMNEIQRRVSPDHGLQIELMKVIGSSSRDYVTQKYPDAEVRYVTNKAR